MENECVPDVENDHSALVDSFAVIDEDVSAQPAFHDEDSALTENFNAHASGDDISVSNPSSTREDYASDGARPDAIFVGEEH
eukprot:9243175-Alexandrium_andersonii.AAC.1